GVAMESSIGVAALFPVFGVWALRAHQGKRPLLLFLTAWCLAVLPSAYFIVPGPDVWFFNVFGHYLLGGSAFGEAPGRLRQLLTLVGVTGSSGAASLQLTLLLVIWLAGLVSSMLLHEPLPRSAPIVFVLLVASLLAASPYAG